MSRHHPRLAVAAATSGAMAVSLALTVAMEPACAQSPAGIDQAAIGAGAMNGFSGRAAINVAAGLRTEQANLAAIAVGPQAEASIGLLQSVSTANLQTGRDAQSLIRDGAFTGATGVLSINQSSGDANRQANTLAIALSNELSETADDASLSRAASTPTQAGRLPAADGRREAGIEPAAFAASRGIVQINQAAGAGNSSANLMTLRAAGLFGNP